jgi:hypothetical protein
VAARPRRRPEEASRWAAEYDQANKIRYCYGRFDSQHDQYAAGIQWLSEQKAEYDLIITAAKSTLTSSRPSSESIRPLVFRSSFFASPNGCLKVHGLGKPLRT